MKMKMVILKTHQTNLFIFHELTSPLQDNVMLNLCYNFYQGLKSPMNLLFHRPGLSTYICLLAKIDFRSYQY